MKFIVRPLARFDLLEEADFIETAYGLDRVRAFLFAANETFTKLAQMPLRAVPAPNWRPSCQPYGNGVSKALKII